MKSTAGWTCATRLLRSVVAAQHKPLQRMNPADKGRKGGSLDMVGRNREQGWAASQERRAGLPGRFALPFRRSSYAATAALIVGFAVALFLLFDVAHAGGIYWARDRSRGAAAAALIVIGAIQALSLVYCPRVPRPTRRIWIIVSLVVLAVCVTIGLWAFVDFSNAGDEYVYQFQARTYLAGRLWNQPPPLGKAMAVHYAWIANGKWVGQYPPGWPAFLALFEGLTPTGRLANAVVTVVTMIVVAGLTQRRAGRQAGWLAALLFGLSPFALFHGGSLFSHSLAALLSVTALLAVRESRRRNSLAWSLLAGAAIGWLGITRLVAAPPVALAVALAHLGGPRRIVRLICVGIAGAPFLGLLLWYQNAITGNPLEPVYYMGGRTADHLYFDLPSIIEGVRNNLQALVELGLYVAPAVLVLLPVALWVLVRRRRFEASDLVFPVGLLMFCFYPLHPGERFGPRYLFDFWPLAVVTIASAVPQLGWQWRNRYRALIVATILYGVVATPFLMIEWRRVTQDRRAVYDVIAARDLHHALVFAPLWSGTLLPMPRSDFARNGIAADSDVLFVDCPTGPAEVAAALRAYPGWSAWAVQGQTGRGPGAMRLAPLAAWQMPATRTLPPCMKGAR
jgi:hypothetical protein